MESNSSPDAYAATLTEVPRPARRWLASQGGPETPGRAVVGWVANELFRLFPDNHAAVMAFVDASAEGIRQAFEGSARVPYLVLTCVAGRFLGFLGSQQVYDADEGVWIVEGERILADAVWLRSCLVHNLVEAQTAAMASWTKRQQQGSPCSDEPS